MPEPYLVSFDTDRIKDYIFATDRLRDVRGASYLLTQLNEKQTEQEINRACPGCKVLYAAGGSAAVIAPSKEKAQQVIAVVEELYARATHDGSITGVCLPLEPPTGTQGFGERMAIAGLRLREKKDEKATRRLAGLRPYTQPCVSCERYPAVRESPIDQTAICESCHAKRAAFDDYQKEEKEQRRDAPENLTRLGETARPPGYIGFILADGNSMGERLKQLASPEAYGAFSRTLDETIKDAMQGTLERHAPRQVGGKTLRPYEPLLVGGDDLMLVAAGDIALPAALEIASAFQSRSPESLRAGKLPDGEPLTLGVGVVLAHAGFPMAAFHRLAIQLLKRAKQRCAEIDYRQSAIDFMVVTEAGSSDVTTVRDEGLTEQAFVFPHAQAFRLTQRPYLLQDAERLLNHLRSFKRANFPRSQLQFLYEGMFHSQAEAVYRWGKVAGRAKEEHRQVLDAFYNNFGDGRGGLPPWRRGNNPPQIDYTTALGDLIEIYQYVPD